MGTYAGWIYRHLTVKPRPLDKNVRLGGETAVVIGVNKGEAVREEIRAQTPAIWVFVWELDHESFQSIDEFRKRTKKRSCLDTVILNASVKKIDYVQSKTGHGSHVQLYLALKELDTNRACFKSLYKVRIERYSTRKLLRGHCLTDAVTFYSEHHGLYLSEQKVKPPSSFVLFTIIWSETVEVLEAEAPYIGVIKLK
ncbi:short-chain dehydrogenase/reductase SDR [Xylariaceae sp. AK1471]|nr:short-chain dehydrogenase/reductase SDR [Xylariaceae sp. AK1471]